jgi:hypothetical protein
MWGILEKAAPRNIYFVHYAGSGGPLKRYPSQGSGVLYSSASELVSNFAAKFLMNTRRQTT